MAKRLNNRANAGSVRSGHGDVLCLLKHVTYSMLRQKSLTPYVTPWYYLRGEVIDLSKWEKLIVRITALSKDVRFAELKKVLESCGYEGRKPRSGSSHWTFRKQGKAPVTIPESEPIKLAYIKLVKDIVESEEK